MSFEENYLAERRHWESATDKVIDALQPLAPRRAGAEASYELMDATVFHLLHPVSVQARTAITRSALKALLVNRNIDHLSAFAGKLCDYLDVVDPANVLDLAVEGQVFFFAGFHTGPYWSIFKALIQRGLNITTLLPDGLEAKRQEIWDVFESISKHVGSSSTLQLITVEDPNFLVHMRSSIAAGRQLVVFLDGNSGHATLKKEKRDVELDFLDSKITVKTTILRLADIFGLPLVTFNARRGEIRRTLFLDSPFASGKGKDYGAVAQIVFGRLANRLREQPDQWEGWLYFPAYFSEVFRSSLDAGIHAVLDKESRYFKSGESILVDKQTYKHYRINKHEGAAA